MRTGAALTALLLILAGAAESFAGPRRTPVVEAVEKTRTGIVTLIVEKQTNWGRKETVGTGVVVDERGYLITNLHVIAGADRVRVELHDGTDLVARTTASDAGCDLAVLKVDAKARLSPLVLGPSSDLMVGETVIAVGHPLGYTNTVSTGIVSALGRSVRMNGTDPLRDLIQVNASINPGNSGGPLLNINGELIGINVALREDAQGIAFAINADTVKAFLSKHLSAMKVSGVVHGLGCKELVKEEGPDRQQVVLADTAGPATEAGLKAGDAVLSIGGRAVANRFDVERAAWERKPGEQLDVVVRRQGREMKLAVKLGCEKAVGTRVAGRN